MADNTQVKLSKNGTTVYPQTVTDAVAYTPTDTNKSKQKLTTYLEGIQSDMEGIQSDIADIEYGNLNPGVNASPASKDVEYSSTISQSVTVTLTASKSINDANHFSDVKLYHKVSGETDFTEEDGATSAAVTVSADTTPSSKSVYAYGTAKYRGSKTVNFGNSATAKATINFVYPSYVGYVQADSLDAVAAAVQSGYANMKKKVAKNIATNSESYTAAKDAYIVVAVPKSGNVLGVSQVTQLGTLNAVLTLDTKQTTTINGVTYQLYIGASRHNAGTYNFKITTTTETI